MTTNAELAKMVADLKSTVDQQQRIINRLTGNVPRTEDLPPKERPDYIEHGSEQHMDFLGLKIVAKGELDDDEITVEEDGKIYAFVDPTQFGLTVEPRILKALLRQRVNQLTMPIVVPADAPSMWIPEGVAARGIV